MKKDLSGFISEEYQKEAEEIKARSNEKVVNILEKDGEDLEDLGKEILEVLRLFFFNYY